MRPDLTAETCDAAVQAPVDEIPVDVSQADESLLSNMVIHKPHAALLYVALSSVIYQG